MEHTVYRETDIRQIITYLNGETHRTAANTRHWVLHRLTVFRTDPVKEFWDNVTTM